MYSEVHVPNSLISKIFEPFLKSCTSEVHVPRGHVPRGLIVVSTQTTFLEQSHRLDVISIQSTILTLTWVLS